MFQYIFNIFEYIKKAIKVKASPEEDDRFFRSTEDIFSNITLIGDNEKGYLVLIAIDNCQDALKFAGLEASKKQSEKIAAMIRGIITENAVLYQITMDRFLIKFPDTKDSEICRWVETLYGETLEEQQIKRPDIAPVLSVGAVSYPKYGNTSEQLLMNVQLNCYQNSYLCRQTKINNYDLHKCNYEFKEYCEDDRVFYTKRMNLERRLRKSIDKSFRGFEVYYQPQIDAKTGICVSAEALLRWRDEDGNMVMPSLLIPALESMRLIDRVGTWIMQEAMRQCEEWGRKGARRNFSISVNLSSSQLYERGLAEQILDILKQYGLPPDRLTIELTETSVMHEIQCGIDLFGQIRGYGVSVSIDDFGSGYSALNYLSRLPIDEVKIDSSFIMNMELDKASMSVVEAIVEIAHSLGLRVCAEGVETKSQLKKLVELGVDLMQGYLYSTPLNAKEFEKRYIK